MNVPASSRLARYLTVILRWLAITLTVFALTLLAGAFITDNLLPKVYTATAQMQIRPRGMMSVGTLLGYDPAFRGEIEIIESSNILLSIIHDLSLDKAWATRVFKSKEDTLLDKDALDYMHKIVKIEVKRGTNIIAITASSDAPQEAAEIPNAIADRYKAMRDAEEDDRNKAGIDSLRDQIAGQQKVVDDGKAALAKLPRDQSPAFRDAELQLERQQSLLYALTIRLQQVVADSQIEKSPVRIISRAEMPSHPDRSFSFLVTMIVAGVLSVMAASFVEIILLFSRAGERTGH